MSEVSEMKWSWIEGTHGMRNQVLDSLSDADLAFNPGGENIILGELFSELGEIEYSYLQAFKTLTQNFDYRNKEAGLANSVEKLKAWFGTLDAEMKQVVAALGEDDLKKMVDRGGWQVSLDVQLDIYLQALLIFFGKLSIYMKALKKAVPQSVKDSIG